jgi:predicted ATPase
MKILLGAHGTGKSTLLEALHKERPDYYVTDGFSRPAKTVKDKLSLTQTQEQILINEFTVWGFENYVKHKNVISTRSPIDAIVYTQVYCSEEIFVDTMLESFLKHKDKVEQIFYIPIEFPLVNDGVRFMDEEKRQLVDKEMQKFTSLFGVEVITVTGSIEERVQQILPYL